jgi:hypothetical protein
VPDQSSSRSRERGLKVLKRENYAPYRFAVFSVQTSKRRGSRDGVSALGSTRLVA